MTVLTTQPGDRAAIDAALALDARLVVVSFCAAWCDSCAEFRAAFERIAASRTHIAFVWLDIEDDATIAGDVDVENFPTLAIYAGAVPLHFGVSLPHESVVRRLVDSLAANPAPATDIPESVAALPRRLRQR